MSRLCLLVAALLSGCANLSTINRTTDLTGGAKAIHLDAAQRLVYTNKDGGVCAEPTPDALQSYAAAMGTGAGVNEKGSIALSNAFSANSASIGLHTQSITLMRDTLYRICEYSNNKNSNPLDIVQLLQRSQDLTLGTLAIEQLTGAVVARQAALSAGAESTSGASINNTEAQLSVAKKNLVSKKAEQTAAQQAEQAQQDVLKAAQAALAAEKAKPTPDSGKVTALGAAVDAEQAREDLLSAASTAATDSVARAQAAVDAIDKMFDSVLTAGGAATSGGAQLYGSGPAQNVDKDTAAVLAAATLQIVATVVNKGHVTDTCMNFLVRPVDKEVVNSANYQSMLTQCNAVIKVYMEQYVKFMSAQTEKGPAPPYTVAPTLPAPFYSLATQPRLNMDDATFKIFTDAVRAKLDVENQLAKKRKK